MADGSFDGAPAAALARMLDLPAVAAYESVESTLDVAHAFAGQGAAPGTLVLADTQSAGRGRAGRRWSSPAGSGLWLTLIERPNDLQALEVLSLRLGLRAARALDRFAATRITLKWPNDLYIGGRKLAGILVEARWRDARPDWVAIGFGLNVRAPTDVRDAVGLAPGASRLDVLAELVPALRAAAAARGPLSDAELDAFAARDLARGRRCLEPARGTVRGITSAGELRVAGTAGEHAYRGGSLVLQEEA